MQNNCSLKSNSKKPTNICRSIIIMAINNKCTYHRHVQCSVNLSVGNLVEFASHLLSFPTSINISEYLLSTSSAAYITLTAHIMKPVVIAIKKTGVGINS